MMEAIYKKFAVEHGLKLGTPTSFSLIRYQQEVDRLEQWCDTHLNTMFQLMTHERTRSRRSSSKKSPGSNALSTRQPTPDLAEGDHGADGNAGARAPDPAQASSGSIKRIHQATDTLKNASTN